jgi:signal transduction histidine kinase
MPKVLFFPFFQIELATFFLLIRIMLTLAHSKCNPMKSAEASSSPHNLTSGTEFENKSGPLFLHSRRIEEKPEIKSLFCQEVDRVKKYREEYINGLEEMMFMMSHKVRQPIANIIGLSYLLEEFVNSPEDQRKIVDYIKQSALALEGFTVELNALMGNLKQKNKGKINGMA